MGGIAIEKIATQQFLVASVIGLLHCRRFCLCLATPPISSAVFTGGCEMEDDLMMIWSTADQYVANAYKAY
jgi:hypothetical protein